MLAESERRARRGTKASATTTTTTNVEFSPHVSIFHIAFSNSLEPIASKTNSAQHAIGDRDLRIDEEIRSEFDGEEGERGPRSILLVSFFGGERRSLQDSLTKEPEKTRPKEEEEKNLLLSSSSLNLLIHAPLAPFPFAKEEEHPAQREKEASERNSNRRGRKNITPLFYFSLGLSLLSLISSSPKHLSLSLSLSLSPKFLLNSHPSSCPS